MLAFLFFISLVTSQSCLRQDQCQQVSTNYNYVQCLNQKCLCRKDLGFVGNATTTSKCYCPVNRIVYWDKNVPYCINYMDAVNFQLKKEKESLIVSKIQELYSAILWPSAARLAYDITLGIVDGSYFQLFDTNVVGRIDPLGDLKGFEGTAEYFIGSVWTGYSRAIGARFQKLFANDDKVYVNVVLTFGIYVSPDAVEPFYVYNLTQTGSFTFNFDNKISSLDLVIRNVELAVGVINQDSFDYRLRLCQTIIYGANCNQSNDLDGFYSNIDDCMNFFATIPFGSWDDVRQNTVICRQYHATLALLRPSFHCPHTGRTGGGKCVLHTSQELYLKDY